MTLHLTEEQRKYVVGLAQQLPAEKRDTFFGAVQFRLGGRPNDKTVRRVTSLIYREIERGERLARRA